jgi:hypothetical protein
VKLKYLLCFLTPCYFLCRQVTFLLRIRKAKFLNANCDFPPARWYNLGIQFWTIKNLPKKKHKSLIYIHYIIIIYIIQKIYTHTTEVECAVIIEEPIVL